MCNEYGHTFVWGGDPNYPIPDGIPCECGLMISHTEKCKECETIINKPLPIILESWPHYQSYPDYTRTYDD